MYNACVNYSSANIFALISCFLLKKGIMPIPPQLWAYNDDQDSNKVEPTRVTADVVLINDSAAIPRKPSSILLGMCHET